MLSKEKLHNLKLVDFQKVIRIINRIVSDDTEKSDCNKYGIAYIMYLNNNSIADLLGCSQFDPELQSFLNECADRYWNAICNVESKPESDELLAYILYYCEHDKVSEYNETPDAICNLSVKLLNLSDTDSIADFCTGSGSFIRSICEQSDNRNIYATEIVVSSRIICKIRAHILGETIQVNQDDILLSSCQDKIQKIFMDPPNNVKIRDFQKSDYSDVANIIENKIGNLQKISSAQWIYALSAVESLLNDGVAVVLMRSNTLWNQSDISIRQYFIDHKYIEKIILLSEGLNVNNHVQTAALVLSHNNDKVQIVDASNIYTANRRSKTIDTDQMLRILEACNTTTDISTSIDLQTIKDLNFDLTPSLYLKSNKPTKYKSILNDYCISINRGLQMRAAAIDQLYSREYTGVKYIAPKLLVSETIEYDLLPDVKLTSNRMHKYVAHPGDLLITRLLFPYSVYIVADLSCSLLTADSFYVIKIDTKRLNPYYLKLYFESEYCRGYIDDKSTNIGSTRLILIDTLRELPIPYVSKEEQDRIVEQYLKLLDEKQELLKKSKEIDLKIQNLLK